MTAALVPELYVSNLARSRGFYCGLLGFQMVYERPAEKFVCLRRGEAELMLEEPNGRTWLTGPLEPPFGRGMHLQIQVKNVEALYSACLAAEASIFMLLETKGSVLKPYANFVFLI